MLKMVFGEAYANQYDTFYAGKDYSGECDLIEQAFRKFGSGEIRSIVDWGCGTGSHSIRLAQRGYAVTGVDRSADMLRLARQKSSENNLDIDWIEGDIRVAPAGGQFDAGLFMFAVLGYLSSNADLIAVLRNARHNLRLGGLLVFDIWYGPAVLSLKPSDRFKIVSGPEGKLLRMVSSSLDTRHHLNHVTSNSWRLMGDRVVEESEEIHTVRYFFPMELELLLEVSGFSLTALTAFPTIDIGPDETSWNAFVVAKAISA
jgi:SAM-dependent methyltransferase